MKYLALLFIMCSTPSYAVEAPEFFDSRTMPGESYLIMDDCFVPLKTFKVKDLCYVQWRIKTECGINYELEKNCDKKHH